MRLNRFVEFGKKIIGVSRNYKDNLIDIGSGLPTKPIFFFKPSSSYIKEGSRIRVPKGCEELNHEVELGVVIARKGVNIRLNTAMDFVGGYTLCLDMTASDFQQEAMREGGPWCLAKGFDTACPVGTFIPKEQVEDPYALSLWCKVNGSIRQEGSTSDMIFKIPHLISYISEYITLEPGDLILTGTPRGVGSVKPGDKIEAGLADLDRLFFQVDTSACDLANASSPATAQKKAA